jgi:signal transduction histidine kinase
VPGGELRIETTICNEIRASHDPVAIGQVSASPLWRGHHAPALYGFESYVSVPIMLSDGTFWGTLCALDPEPRRVEDADTLGLFALLAELIAREVEDGLRLAAAQKSLSDEKEESLLRERFLAVLGHDLRNPLAAIDGGTRLLAKDVQDRRGQEMLGMMRNAVARMAGLVDDLFDFARGRFGGGIPVQAAHAADLARLFGQIVDEMRIAWPEREIVVEIKEPVLVRCDPRRIGQLFSNLLGNALVHGAHDRPILVGARIEGESFYLGVGNQGIPIEQDALERIFDPFVRGPHSSAGLGLGLYIAAQIARSHGGELSAHSDAGGTRMTFRMPLTGAPEAVPVQVLLGRANEGRALHGGHDLAHDLG